MITEVKTERNEKARLKLQEKAKTLPSRPGCYLMKRSDGVVLYVGKAKNLRSRVGSYFNNSTKTPKTEILVGHIRDFDFQLTKTETEAFILENNLIKRYSPKYNIMMRDDKSYPYVYVDFNEPFPKLVYARRIKRAKGKEVFGPFVHGSNISEVLRIVTKSFGLRDCSLREFKSRKEPCLLYQIKQCSAPCVKLISEERYAADLDLALDFFRGKGKKSLKELENRMHLLAENEEFEHAAIVRDYIETLENFLDVSQQQNAELDIKEPDVDVVAYYEGDVEIDIAVYMVRNNILLGHKNFHFPKADITESVSEEVLNFLFQYYASTHDSLPDTVVVPFEKNELKILSGALQSELGLKVKPPGRTFKNLMHLTTEQASEHQRVRLSNQESEYVGLNKLRDLLGMRERPVILECYDVAVFQGSSPTASQIVFIEGRAEKKRYRYYHLTELTEGNNDFEMMREVLARRLKAGDLPDVFIVDGGVGQVNAFKAVLSELGLDIPVCGIAKSKTLGKFKDGELKKTEERLIIPGRSNPYILNKNKALFRIITQMRDEAHRFSRKLHHKAEKKRTFSSWIDQIEGVGPKLKEKILMKLDKSRQELAEMSVEEIMTDLDLSKKIAENLMKVVKEE